MQVKITISSEDRIVIIPMEYKNDELSINELQIEPYPNKDDDISKDVVMHLTKAIMEMFKNIHD